MKSPIVVAAVVVVLLACSTASAATVRVGPVVVRTPTVVHSFYPVGPVYTYPAPVVAVTPHVAYRPSVVVSAPAIAPATVVYRPAVVYRPVVVAPAPVVVRPKVYVLGQPVRNVIRAVLP
jgi:hypothetical protein